MHQDHLLLGDRTKMKLLLPPQNDQMKVRFVSWWNTARPQERKLLLPPQNDQMKVRFVSWWNTVRPQERKLLLPSQNDQMKVRFVSWWNIARPQERKLPFPVEMRSTSLPSDSSCAASLHMHEKEPSCRCNR